MSEMLKNSEVMKMVVKMASDHDLPTGARIYGVPRGGVPVAYLLAPVLAGTVVDRPEDATIIVDDLIDSGATMTWYLDNYPDTPFVALLDKRNQEHQTWYVFPWEGTVEGSAEDIPTRLLQYLGEDVSRDGLVDTPARFLKAWGELTAGYKVDPKSYLERSFSNEAGYDQMVILRDIEVCSVCEHHLLPFVGKAHVAYIPSADGRVVGISKLARLVDGYARRLQIQERLTQEVAGALEECLNPKGVAVFIEAQHLCMRARGVRERDSVMVTSAIRGAFVNEPARLEFLLLRQ